MGDTNFMVRASSFKGRKKRRSWRGTVEAEEKKGLGGFVEDDELIFEDWATLNKYWVSGAVVQLVPVPLMWKRISGSMRSGQDKVSATLDFKNRWGVLRPLLDHYGWDGLFGAALVALHHETRHDQEQVVSSSNDYRPHQGYKDLYYEYRHQDKKGDGGNKWRMFDGVSKKKKNKEGGGGGGGGRGGRGTMMVASALGEDGSSSPRLNGDRMIPVVVHDDDDDDDNNSSNHQRHRRRQGGGGGEEDDVEYYDLSWRWNAFIDGHVAVIIEADGSSSRHGDDGGSSSFDMEVYLECNDQLVEDSKKLLTSQSPHYSFSTVVPIEVGQVIRFVVHPIGKKKEKEEMMMTSPGDDSIWHRITLRLRGRRKMQE